jgi:hypothetical protein
MDQMARMDFLDLSRGWNPQQPHLPSIGTFLIAKMRRASVHPVFVLLGLCVSNSYPIYLIPEVQL